MKKKKEITMLGIWSPIAKKPILCSLEENTSWRVWIMQINAGRIDKTKFEDQGYRVVKGKFVWEEKV